MAKRVKLEINVTPLEEKMSALTNEISKLKEIVLALAKKTTEKKNFRNCLYYVPKRVQARL